MSNGTTPHRTVITDIDVPFWRIVAILIKWTIAAIPALIVVWLIVMLFAVLASALFGLVLHEWFDRMPMRRL